MTPRNLKLKQLPLVLFLMLVAHANGSMTWVFYRNGYEDGVWMSYAFFIAFWAMLGWIIHSLFWHLYLHWDSFNTDGPFGSG